MINQKTYSFFIKFIVFVVAFLGISFLVKSLYYEATAKIKTDIPYLSLPDEKVDSIILTLKPKDKAELIFRDSFPENFKIINEKNVLFSIQDTSLTNKFLSQTCLGENKNIILDISRKDLLNMADSSYLSFLLSKIKSFKTFFHNKNRLFGLKLDIDLVREIDTLWKDSSLFLYDFHKELSSETDFVVLNSAETKGINLNFNGIVLAEVDSISTEKTELVKKINGPIDLFICNQDNTRKLRRKAKRLIRNNEINNENSNQKLRKLVKANIWSKGGVKFEKDSTESLITEHLMVQKSICLVNNKDSVIPILNIHNQNFAIVWIGGEINKSFSKSIENYTDIKTFKLFFDENNWQKKLAYLQKSHFIIYALDTLITDTMSLRQFEEIKTQMPKNKSLIINFSNYENLKLIPDSLTCIQAQKRTHLNYNFTAQSIFGGFGLNGSLPYNISDNYKFNKSNISNKTRLSYTIPEMAGLDRKKLNEINNIALQGVHGGAFPGCQVFVAKNGKVILNKSYGYHTYSRRRRVRDNDVYDLASVTKIAATTIAMMHMISKGDMQLNDKLGKFFKDTKIDYTRIKPDTIIKIDTFFVSTIQNWDNFLEQNDTLNISDTSFITMDTVITKLTPSRNIFKVALFDLLKHKSGILPAMPVFRYMFYKAYYIRILQDQLATLHGDENGELFKFKMLQLPSTFPDNTNLPDSLKAAIKKGFQNEYNKYFSNSFIQDTSEIQLSENRYFKQEYFDTVWRDTKQLHVYSHKVFQYSDVNMILLQMAIDSTNNSTIDKYLKKNLYKQLGLKTATYLPLNYYGKHKIIPTEFDLGWRSGSLHGFVHDPSAAVIGGLAGNAGLYSNAHDLGILFQMVLNKGTYGGRRYIKPGVIEQFTSRFDDTQRALGFDMKNRKARIGSKASEKAYGHSGYTGTCVWVDPEHGLVYVFLSNRNHPKSTNWRITKYRTRERIHDAIYDAIIKDEVEEEEKVLANK